MLSLCGATVVNNKAFVNRNIKDDYNYRAIWNIYFRTTNSDKVKIGHRNEEESIVHLL